MGAGDAGILRLAWVGAVRCPGVAVPVLVWMAKAGLGISLSVSRPRSAGRRLTRIRQDIQGRRIHRRSNMMFAEIIAFVNIRVAGWAAYYGRFYKSAPYAAFHGLSVYLMRWTMRINGGPGREARPRCAASC